MKIYKYKIDPTDTFLSIRGFKKLLSLVVIGNEIFIYAIIEPFVEISHNINFDVIATGMNFDPRGTFLGTAVLDDGAFIVHIFYY